MAKGQPYQDGAGGDRVLAVVTSVAFMGYLGFAFWGAHSVAPPARGALVAEAPRMSEDAAAVSAALSPERAGASPATPSTVPPRASAPSAPASSLSANTTPSEPARGTSEPEQPPAQAGSPAAMEGRLVPPTDAPGDAPGTTARGSEGSAVAEGETAPAQPRVAQPGLAQPGLSMPGLAQPGDAIPSGADFPMEFLVKFQDGRGIDLRDRFLESPNAARAYFAREYASKPGFANLALKRVSYGGECTLVYTGPPPGTANGPATPDGLAASVVERLTALDGVQYAEPNLIGWRGSIEP